MYKFLCFRVNIYKDEHVSYKALLMYFMLN